MACGSKQCAFGPWKTRLIFICWLQLGGSEKNLQQPGDPCVSYTCFIFLMIWPSSHDIKMLNMRDREAVKLCWYPLLGVPLPFPIRVNCSEVAIAESVRQNGSNRMKEKAYKCVPRMGDSQVLIYWFRLEWIGTDRFPPFLRSNLPWPTDRWYEGTSWINVWQFLNCWSVGIGQDLAEYPRRVYGTWRLRRELATCLHFEVSLIVDSLESLLLRGPAVLLRVPGDNHVDWTQVTKATLLLCDWHQNVDWRAVDDPMQLASISDRF